MEARISRQRQRTVTERSTGYPAHSLHGPYAEIMQAAEAVTQAALARVDSIPARRGRPAGQRAKTRCRVELRRGATVEIRHYGHSPSTVQIMDPCYPVDAARVVIPTPPETAAVRVPARIRQVHSVRQPRSAA